VIDAIAGLIDSAFKFATTGLEVYQARVTAEMQERDRSHSEAVEARRRDEERQLAREQYIQGRRDKAQDNDWALKRDKELERTKAELRNYPIRSGPGALRRSIALLRNYRREPPLVVLFVPAHESADPNWGSLPRRLQAALLATEDLESVALITDRWLSWPDAALIDNDLYDVPTIVVSAEVITGQLALRLGGCNLGGDEMVRNLRQILWMQLPSGDYWTDARLQVLELTSTSSFRRPSASSPEFERELQLEWATRLAMVGIISAIDAYYLLRHRGYREHLDDAVAVLGPEHALTRSPIPVHALADAPYHLMHQARRQLAAGEKDAATASVSEAVLLLGGDRDVPLGEAVLTARSSGHLESWHEVMLEELALASRGTRVVPPVVLTALRQPPAEPAADETPSSGPAAPAGDRKATASRDANREAARRWPGRPVTEIRQRPAGPSKELSRGRPVAETWPGAAAPEREER
jgi:hypothetical protein